MAEEYEEGIIEGQQSSFEQHKDFATVEEENKDDKYSSNVLFVSRYRYAGTTENHIREAFEQFGPVKDVALKTNFSFVEFVNLEDAQKAKHNMHRHPGLGSESLIVDFKKDGQPKQRSKHNDHNGHHRGRSQNREGPRHGDNFRGPDKPYYPPPDLDAPRYPPTGPRYADDFPPRDRPFDGPPGRGPHYPPRSPPRMPPQMGFPRSERGPPPPGHFHDRPPFDGGRNFVPGDFHPRNGPGIPPPFPDGGYYRKEPPFRDNNSRNGPPPSNDYQGRPASYPPRDRSNSPPRDHGRNVPPPKASYHNAPPPSYRDGPPAAGGRGGYDDYGPPPGSRSPPAPRSPPRGHSPPHSHSGHHDDGRKPYPPPNGGNKRPYDGNMNDNYGGGNRDGYSGGGGGGRSYDERDRNNNNSNNNNGNSNNNGRGGGGIEPSTYAAGANRYRQPSPPMMHPPRGPDFHPANMHHGRGPPPSYPPSLGPPPENFSKRPRY